MVHIQGGFASAGAGNRTGRRIHTRFGVSTTAKERNRRVEKVAREVNISDPPKEEFMKYVEVGQCWWCDDGRTFESLSQHWVKAHGIDLQWLKDYLVLPKKYAFISDGLRAGFSERQKLLYDPTKINYMEGVRKKRKLSRFGCIAQQKKGNTVKCKLGIEHYQKMSRLGHESKVRQNTYQNPEYRKKISASRKMYFGLNPDAREAMTGSSNISAKLDEVGVLKIKQAIASGAADKNIAVDFGVVPQTIQYIRLGYTWKHVQG